MELRDRLNTREGYLKLIENRNKFIIEDLEDIKLLNSDSEKGIQTYSKPNDEVIKSIRSTILINYFDLIILEYSIGQEVARIKNTFIKLLVFMIDYWEEKSLDEFKFGDIDEPFYSTDEYWQLLTIISFSIILDLNDEYFERLILIRDKVKGSDILLDFMINSRFNREVKNSRLNSNKYLGLVEIIEKRESIEGIKEIENYLSNNWFKEYKEMGWVESHKSKHNIHKGYWSFESAAIVKILKLDFNNQFQHQYYPGDLLSV